MDNIYKQKFVERVKKHINLVNKYASRVGEYFSEHDSDKLTEPLLSVYYLDMKSNNKTLSSSEQESLRQAGMNHRTENQHHPEFWDKGNIKNMTGLRTHPTTPFNVQKMPKRALIEMCADWCAMSEEFGNTPFEWFDYINGVRYNFSKSQEEFILNTLHKMWHNTDKSIDEEINEVLKLSGVNLTEGIEEVKKYFPKIKDSTFTKLIELDPTYNGGNELGKYSKWILNLYNKFIKDKLAYEKWEEQKKLGNNFPEPIKKSQEQIEDFDKLPNILKDFDVLNNKLRVNINNVKSVAELYKIVNDAKKQGISTNSKVNKGIDLVKKSVERGGEVVFKDNNWIVLIPETLESSVVFGEDTNWCTTASNGKMYKYYKNKFGGEYFINLNLQTGELYQFHFESEQFMDKNDKKVDIVELLYSNMPLFNFYKKYFGSSLVGKVPLGIMFVDNPTEQVQLEAVKENGYTIRFIKNPSEQVQMVAVKQNGYVIQFIKNPSEQIQLAAVTKNGTAIQYIKNPTEQVQLEAVKQNGNAIEYIRNPLEQVQLTAVKQDGRAILYIENPSEQVQLAAVKQRSYVIQYIENPSEQVQLEAIQKDVYVIQYIKNPSEQVQLAAVKQNGYAIKYINNPSEEIKLAAVKHNGNSILYIRNPSEQVKLEAVKQDGNAIEFIRNPSEQVKLEAVKQDGNAIEYIRNPSEKVQLAAVTKNGNAIKYIKNPSEKVKEYLHMKTNQSTNKSIDEEINEVLKLSGVNLTEGIADVAKYYPSLDFETIKSLINLDPTYNGGNELGKYSKWILNLYNKFIKDKLAYEKWEEQKKLGNDFPQPTRKSTDKQEDFEKIPNLLKQFNVLNKKLKTNIDKITSISELYKVVNDAKDKGLSDNSKVQKGIDLFKKSVEKGGEVVFKNKNWVILVPKTLESSVVFGKDTNWCTTASNGRMYDYYLKKHGGKYFINLNLQTGDLYQFHFESEQLMDSNDSNVEFQDIIKDDSVKKFYLDYLYGQLDITKKPSILIYIIVKNDDNAPEYIQMMAVRCRIHIKDIKNPTEKVQLMAVKEYPYAIQYIKNPTEEMQLEAIKQNGNAIQYIKNPTEEMKLEAVKNYPHSIQYIKNPTEEMQLIAIKYDGYALGYIKNPTEKVQMASIKENGCSIRYIKNPTEEMKLEAVKENGYAIEYIDNPTEEMKLEAVKENGYAIQYIKNPSEEIQLIAVKYDSDSIHLIDNPSEKVKEYVRMKTNQSTNKSIDEEINEVLKLSGVN